ACMAQEFVAVLLHESVTHRAVRLARKAGRRETGHVPRVARGVPMTASWGLAGLRGAWSVPPRTATGCPWTTPSCRATPVRTTGVRKWGVGVLAKVICKLLWVARVRALLALLVEAERSSSRSPGPPSPPSSNERRAVRSSGSAFSACAALSDSVAEPATCALA